MLRADARHIPLADGSVHCVMTSPPYWALRDYKLEPSVWGGVPGCGHEWGDYSPSGTFCQQCGAWRGVLGLEPTPDLYVQHIVEVFREVGRVLRDDGTLWLNLGDSYNAAGRDIHGTRIGEKQGSNRASATGEDHCRPSADALKPKDLCGIPWRVAFALQADGWYLRSDIIWAKPNPMPESVTDRPTKAHEYVFLLSKREMYFYDTEAIREVTGNEMTWDEWDNNRKSWGEPRTNSAGVLESYAGDAKKDGGRSHPLGRNARTVWEIPTEAFPESHFATFPTELARRCIAAGSSERGCCPRCRAPWGRVSVDTPEYAEFKSAERERKGTGMGTGMRSDSLECFGLTRGRGNKSVSAQRETLGWQPTCRCDAGEPIPCTVLDPFVGSGTVGEVAFMMGRSFVLLDLKPEYLEMMRRRIPPIAFLATATVVC